MEGELLPQGDSGVKIQDFSKTPLFYNGFVLIPLLLQLLNHSSSTDEGGEPLSHLDFKLSNLALTADCPSIGFGKF